MNASIRSKKLRQLHATPWQRQSLRHVFYTRFAFALLFLAYLAHAGHVAPGLLPLESVLGGLALYTSLSLLLFLQIRRQGLNDRMISTGMGLDLCMLALAYCHDPYLGTPSIVVAPLILLGNGLRHGMRFYYAGLMLLYLLVALCIGLRLLFSPAGLAMDAAFATGFSLIAASYGGLLLHRFRQQRDQLETQSRFDEVTGLLNRRAVRRLAERTLDRCRRLQQSCMVMYMDLDNFKKINDMHGHGAGDAALAAVADKLSRTLPDEALCGRHGGDEFVVVQAGMNHRQATVLRQEIQAAVGQIAQRWPDCGLGISVGFAFAPMEGYRLDQLLTRADRSMYAHKREQQERTPDLTPRLSA